MCRDSRARLRRGGRWLVRVASQTARRWQTDRCSQEAASLAFKTVLGLVPLFAVAFALLKAVGALDARGALVEFFAAYLFPASDERLAVGTAVVTFADNIASGVLGSTGLIVLILVVYLLFHDIEAFWNRIWSSPRSRSTFSKFFVFYTFATLVPFLLAISLYHTARYWRGGLIGYLAPFASTFVALLLANRLLPAARVRWLHAGLGAVVSAMLVELAKLGFARYVAVVLGRYRSIYGALGLVPLLLVWIYVAWLVVLLGAEIAHAAQRLATLEAGDRRRHGSDSTWELISRITAARLMLEVARRYSLEGRPMQVPELAEALALPEEVVVRIIERLHARNLILEASGESPGPGWIPARPPANIKLNQVLGAFRVSDVDNAHDRLALILAELETVEQSKGDITLADLLLQPQIAAETAVVADQARR